MMRYHQLASYKHILGIRLQISSLAQKAKSVFSIPISSPYMLQ